MSAATLAARLRIEAATAAQSATCHSRHSATCGDFSGQKTAATEGERPHATAATGATAFLIEGGTKNTESRPDQAVGPGSSRPNGRYVTGASWRPLAADYYRHHFGCWVCIAAGKGYGQRCTAGADLWAAYEAACEAEHATTHHTTRKEAR